MSAVEILPTGSEPLRRQLTTAGVGLTGATVRCDVRRSADGLYLDFADSTFKAIGVVGTRYRVLAPVDAVESPGLYEGTALDLSAIVGGGAVGAVLTVTYYTTAPSALTLDQDELRVVAAGATSADVTAGTAAVLAGIITDHGAGSYIAPSVAGLALEATLTAMKGAGFNGATDSLEALRDRGDAAWITATGFATSGALATEQTDITSILAFGAPPSAATVATQVWATATTDGLYTYGVALSRLHRRQRHPFRLLANGTIQYFAVNGVTVETTRAMTDVDGNAITAPAAGDPARAAVEVDV